MTFNIQEVNYGIASRVGDTIYINKRIKGYDMGLYMSLIEHEEKHSNTFTIEDIKSDFINNELRNSKAQYYKFVLTHPSSWTEFLPLQILNKEVILSPTLLLFWFIVLMITLS